MNSVKNAWDLIGLPRWKCHKVVNAAEILSIDIVRYDPEIDGHKKSFLLYGYAAGSVDQHFTDRMRHIQRRFDLGEFADVGAELIISHNPPISIKVKPDWMKRHNPQIGGYYVGYSDGYDSYSPKQAFEEGYRLHKLPPRADVFQLDYVTECDEGYSTSFLGRMVASDGNRRGRAVHNILTIPHEFAEIHGKPGHGDYLKWMRGIGYVGIVKKENYGPAAFIPDRELVDMELYTVTAIEQDDAGGSYTLRLAQPADTAILLPAARMPGLNLKVGEKVGIVDDNVVAVVRGSFVIMLPTAPNPLHFGVRHDHLLLGIKEVIQIKDRNCILRVEKVGLIELAGTEVSDPTQIEVGDSVQFVNGVITGVIKKAQLEACCAKPKQEN